jgi:biotin carboxyl carrier protein
VTAEAGQQVASGASLVVLEAMKMENDLKSAAAGVVESVSVVPGQTVEKGTVLVTFRP